MKSRQGAGQPDLGSRSRSGLTTHLDLDTITSARIHTLPLAPRPPLVLVGESR